MHRYKRVEYGWKLEGKWIACSVNLTVAHLALGMKQNDQTDIRSKETGLAPSQKPQICYQTLDVWWPIQTTSSERIPRV